ncbi:MULTISPECIES: ATP-binding protein [unclassified Bradyrhizobium]|uniref:ATP-binding protein n=1 Tax=unclassified Bradyrhizobium TaxID=2631580 RepID=UPI00291692F8|nr:MULTISPECIES: ATP-binding protein [unclassified Bradyrhizobium]
MKTVIAAPKAAMLIESMRDIGYSLETALADVIDNSITAKAGRIDILTDLEHLRVGILDNGEGMTEEQLLAAMRPGSTNPRDARNPVDLGRFGLGLKTASFSQCRRVTVLTRAKGITSAAIWDLDFVAERDDWLVQIPDDAAAIPWADRLPTAGTLVVWEKLDRVLEQDKTDAAIQRFIGRLDDSRDHLELVFHRFLSGEPGLKRIEIRLNERPLSPFDPFHSSHPATIAEPLTPEVIKVGEYTVQVQTFTLPHHKKVTPQEWERYAGKAGYVKNQGFYVYRQKRLIIHGTWFGLARQMELTKLTRVRIDMPNGLDADWKIDVKKASAQPPYQVRERLRRIIETIGATSKRVYTSRGRVLVTDSRLPVWNRVQDKNEISYRINADHPVVAEFAGELSDEQRQEFTSVIELLASSLPMDALFADLGGSPDKVTGLELSDDALRHVVTTTVSKLLETGVKPHEIIAMLEVTEPFRSNWGRAEAIADECIYGRDEGVGEPEKSRSCG